MRRTLVFMILAISGQLAVAQDTRPRLAIRTFENPTTYSNSSIGNALTEILSTEIAKTGRYRLIERQAVDEILKELNFAGSDAANSKTFAQRGGLLGVEYFVFGKVTNFSYRENTQQVVVPDYPGQRVQTLYIQQAEVRLDFRVVSAKTGEAVISQDASAQNENRSARSELQVWYACLREGFALTTTEASSSLIGRTSVQAVGTLARKLSDLAGELRRYAPEPSGGASSPSTSAEGRVLGLVGQSEFIVSLGSKAGLALGDRLIISAEAITRSQKGEVIYRQLQEVAKGEVIDLESSGERARARLIGQPAAAIQEGHSVKVDPGRAETAPGAARPASPSSTSPSAPAAIPAEAVAAIVKQGDRYLEDKYYAQALQQYQKALESLPDNFQLLDKISTAQLFLGQWLETEQTLERILKIDREVLVPVAHRHFSDCEGMLVLRKGRLSFQGRGNDHRFAASRSDLKGIRMFDDTGYLEFTVRMADGKDRKFDLLPLPFAERRKVQFNTSEHVVQQGRGEDNNRLLRILLRLIQRYL